MIIGDTLSYKIHSIDRRTSAVSIPDQEIRIEFLTTLLKDERTETLRLILESNSLLTATRQQREEAVAEAIEAVHNWLPIQSIIITNTI